jgi:hypothetical protein
MAETPEPAAFLAQLIAGFSENSLESLARKIYEPAIIADVESLRPGRESRAEIARKAKDDCWREYKEVAPRLAALEGRLSEAEQFDCSANLDVEDSSLSEWREASARQLANEKATAELRQRIALIKPMIDEKIAANGKASAESDAAEHELDELSAAVADPFASPLGKSTPGYRQYLVHSGKWRLHLQAAERDSPTGKAARRVVLDVLKASGLLDELEAEAISRHDRRTELRDRVNALNASPGNPHWQGSLK